MVDPAQRGAPHHQTPQEVGGHAIEVLFKRLGVLYNKDEVHDKRPPELAQKRKAREDPPDLESPQDLLPREHERHGSKHARRREDLQGLGFRV